MLLSIAIFIFEDIIDWSFLEDKRDKLLKCTVQIICKGFSKNKFSNCILIDCICDIPRSSFSLCGKTPYVIDEE